MTYISPALKKKRPDENKGFTVMKKKEISIKTGRFRRWLKRDLGLKLKGGELEKTLAMYGHHTHYGVIRYHYQQYGLALENAARWGGNRNRVIDIHEYIKRCSNNALPSVIIYQWLSELTVHPESAEVAFTRHLEWLIAQIGWLGTAEANDLRTAVEQETDIIVKQRLIEEIVKATRSRKRRSINKKELTQAIANAKRPNIRSDTVSGFLSQVRKTVGSATHRDVERAKGILDSSNRDPQGIGLYLLLETALPSGEIDRVQANRFVTALRKTKYSRTFWIFLKQLAKRTPPTESDIEYLATVSQWAGTSRSSLLPALHYGQKWYSSADTVVFTSQDSRSTSRLALQSGENAAHSLRSLAARCWLDITSSKRRYEVPSAGRAEILVDAQLNCLTDLKSLRFVQESAKAPAVFIQLAFGDDKLIGIAKVKKDGTLEGMNQLYSDDWSKMLIRAIILSYYLDLVLPGELVEATPQGRKSPLWSTSERYNSPSRSQLPRRPGRPQPRTYSLQDWYEAQEAVRKHAVTGHIRWVGNNFHASPEKVAQARMAGITLKRGFTWVIEHERGDPTSRLAVPLDGVDLTRHTLFSPPRRATERLSEALAA